MSSNELRAASSIELWLIFHADMHMHAQSGALYSSTSTTSTPAFAVLQAQPNRQCTDIFLASLSPALTRLLDKS
jgi:hypothetical protein